jgi:hypothetical protein
VADTRTLPLRLVDREQSARYLGDLSFDAVDRLINAGLRPILPSGLAPVIAIARADDGWDAHRSGGSILRLLRRDKTLASAIVHDRPYPPLRVVARECAGTFAA